MSTNISGLFSAIAEFRCNSIYSVPSRTKESLADYVSRIRREKNLSRVDVERKSRKQISDAYVSQIEAGDNRNLSIDKLIGLAKGLDVPEDEVFAVVRGKPLQGDLSVDESRLLDNFRALPPDRQEDALLYLESLAQRYKSIPAGEPEKRRHPVVGLKLSEEVPKSRTNQKR